MARSSPIDAARKARWLRDYASYVPKAVNEERIDRWLRQFAPADTDIAARLLDSVQFFSGESVGEAFKAALRALPGWHLKKGRRTGIWRFVELSQSSGESGGVMAHRFRVANGLDSARYKELFITPSMLAAQKPGPDHNIVLMDDIVGTGKQVCDGWSEMLQELTAGSGNVYLLVVAAYRKGRDRVHDETELQVRAAHLLGDNDNVFAAQCGHFSAAEKERLMTYCVRASSEHPKGRGECGLNVVFYHRCPNISVPVWHISQPRWRGLFPRHA